MSRVLLADDSPHAQRMGERILRDEGYEVVSVTDGDTALLRLSDVDPDVIVVDAFLPRRSGFDIARHIKGHPEFKHVSVVMTAGLLEPFNEDEARQAGGDAVLKKPFEATAMLDILRPLAESSKAMRSQPPGARPPAQAAAPAPTPTVEPARATATAPATAATPDPAPPPAAAPVPAPASVQRPATPAVVRSPAAPVREPIAPPARGAAQEAIIEPERVRAAVTLALDAAMPALIDELTERVLAALKH
jgi:CheY-like chemotaxis protein